MLCATPAQSAYHTICSSSPDARGTCGTAVGRRAPRRCGRRTRAGASLGCPGHTVQTINRRSPRLSCAHSAEPELPSAMLHRDVGLMRRFRSSRADESIGRHLHRHRSIGWTQARASIAGLGFAVLWTGWCADAHTVLYPQPRPSSCSDSNSSSGWDERSQLTLLQSTTDGGT